MKEQSYQELPVTPADVEFTTSVEYALLATACPGCGSAQAARAILGVRSVAKPGDRLRLFSCVVCGTLRYDPPDIRDYHDLDQVADDTIHHYVDIGGGVWETVWPLLTARRRGSLLDVGCGFGFAIDFWRRSGRGEAIGVESADYGPAGARILGVTVLDERLDRSDALQGRIFDVVYASEVVEHVRDPAAFMQQLARHVADEGELVLTTPAAEYVRPECAGFPLLAALSPGYHAFLLSSKAFEALVRSAGFRHVEVRVEGPRQVLRASKRRPLEPWGESSASCGEVRDYLRLRAIDRSLDGRVRLGYGYRLLRDLVFAGMWRDANAAEERLASDLRDAFGPQICDPAFVVEGYRNCRALPDVGRVGPYFLPAYFHLAAAVARSARGAVARSGALDRAAAALMRECARIAPLAFQEPIAMYWPACLNAATSSLASEIDSDAGDLIRIAECVANGRGLTRSGLWTRLDRTTVEREIPPMATRAVFRNRVDGARILADAYRNHVAESYGTSATTQEGVAAALADPSARLPADPLFVPWFDALVLMGDEKTRERGRARARDLIAIAESARDHPRHGVALAAFARRAREHAGLPPASPIVALETSFRIAPRRR